LKVEKARKQIGCLERRDLEYDRIRQGKSGAIRESLAFERGIELQCTHKRRTTVCH
jgi:hypothetical protein